MKGNFTKLAKLEFLNPDGSVAYSLDNQEKNKRSHAFIQDGQLTVNLQNGRRRQCTVTLANINGEYDYAVNKLWFGQEIRLSEGLILPDGTEFYLPQGIFLIESPKERISPNQKTVTLDLADKWAYLDGTLFGNLESVYSVKEGTNTFSAMEALLKLSRYTMDYTGKDFIDGIAPLFTNWYNDKTQIITDGRTAPFTKVPYDILTSEDCTIADVILRLAETLAAWVGYNEAGRLVIDPSQDDISDIDKPVMWDFTMDEPQLLDISYTPKPTEVHNILYVYGATNDVNRTAYGFSRNDDPASDTCVSRIGAKIQRISMPNYYSYTVCRDYAEWQLKRKSVLSKTVALTTTQMFHIKENQIITVRRDDKVGSPIERHLVQGFTRPLAQTGTMTINAVSVNDYPNVTSGPN